jgi:hypothetical protein
MIMSVIGGCTWKTQIFLDSYMQLNYSRMKLLFDG